MKKSKNDAKPCNRLLPPPAVCVRITSRCNACCRFCFAPPGHHQPDAETLLHRLDWLLTHGAAVIHFCGGEPTLHPDLPRLLLHVRKKGGGVRLTTNALAFPGDLIPVLRESCAQVKVSLHGDRDFHNDMVGAQGFDKTVDNLRRLLAADIPTSIQTMLAASGLWTPDWLATFCLKEGVRRLSILPFVPRGHGAACSGELMLSPLQRRFSREHIKQKRRLLSGHLDIRWLDFNQHPYFIIDTNGDALQEGGPGNGSRMLFRIPGKTI